MFSTLIVEGNDDWLIGIVNGKGKPPNISMVGIHIIGKKGGMALSPSFSLSRSKIP
jgi:hypothetical protein